MKIIALLLLGCIALLDCRNLHKLDGSICYDSSRIKSKIQTISNYKKKLDACDYLIEICLPISKQSDTKKLKGKCFLRADLSVIKSMLTDKNQAKEGEFCWTTVDLCDKNLTCRKEKQTTILGKCVAFTSNISDKSIQISNIEPDSIDLSLTPRRDFTYKTTK